MSSVKKNITWNLLGNVLPLLAGLIFFPMIVDAYGVERFGLLTLAWALVGYFGLFDLGLSRALTQLVSDSLSKKRSPVDVAELVRTCFMLMWGMGVLGGVLLWLSSPLIVVNLLNVTSPLQQETILAFSVLALSIPIVVHTSAMRGVLESLHLFKSASLIRMVMGVGTFAGPYLASTFTPSLVGAVVSLIAVRVIVWALHILAINQSRVLDVNARLFSGQWLGPLFSFGGWMTLTNIIGPLMVYMDRFVIVSMLGAASVAYYVAPYEVVTKMLVVPVAIAGVLFPLFAREWSLQPRQSADRLNQGILYTLIVLFPPSLLLVYFASDWLALWLGAQFAGEGVTVVTWLVSGVLVNSVAQILFAKVQGAGRSDWTAKLHLAELLPYLAVLWLALHFWGIDGAAFAWFFRVLIDTLGLIFFAWKINTQNLQLSKHSLLLMLLSIIVLLGSLLIHSAGARYLTVFISLLVYSVMTFRQLRRDDIFSWLISHIK